jgi:hypothetical protein
MAVQEEVTNEPSLEGAESFVAACENLPTSRPTSPLRDQISVGDYEIDTSASR